MGVVWFVASAWAETGVCGRVPFAEIRQASAAMHAAVQRMDDRAFDDAREHLVSSVPCIHRVLSVDEVTVLHEAMALAAFVNGQVDAAQRSLSAARYLDPRFVVDGRVFPTSHPYRMLYAAADEPGPEAELVRVRRQSWIVDGSAAVGLPLERAFVLQRVGDDGVVSTRYVWTPGEIAPAWSRAAEDRGARRPSVPPYSWTWTGDVGIGAARETQDLDAAVSLFGWTPALSLAARFTPVHGFGLDGAVRSFGPAAAMGDGVWPSAHLVAVVGGASRDESQVHAGWRAGIGAERLRNLIHTGTSLGPSTSSVLVALVTGPEIGVRALSYRALATFDVNVVGGRFSGVQSSVRAGARIRGPVAIEASCTYRASTALLVSAADAGVGLRESGGGACGVGLGVWLERASTFRGEVR